MAHRRGNIVAGPIAPTPPVPGIDLFNAGVIVPGGPFTALRATGGNPVFSNLGGGIGGVAAMGGGGGVGPGTVNTLAMFTGVNAVGDSPVKHDPGFAVPIDALWSNNAQVVVFEDFLVLGGAQVDQYIDFWPDAFNGNGLAITGFDYTTTGGHRVPVVPLSSYGQQIQSLAAADGAWFGDSIRGDAIIQTNGGTRLLLGTGVSTVAQLAIGDDGVAFGLVMRAANGAGFGITNRGGSYTLDNDVTDIIDASGGPIVVALPAASAAPGRWYNLKRIDSVLANSVSVTPAGGDTIDGVNAPLAITVTYQSYNLQSDGVSGWWIL